MRTMLVTGAQGQLGTCFRARLGMEAHALSRRDLDIADPTQVRATIAQFSPQVIINCASYNNVDGAESDAAAAMQVNADAVASLAEAADEQDAVLVQFSTDFVFDGEQAAPYSEFDAPRPLCVYGASKLRGEEHAASARRHYIVRLSSLFGGHTNRAFVNRILDLAAAGQRVTAFVDRTVSPSYAPDVVSAVLALISRQAPSGIYHCGSSDAATWNDVAAFLLESVGRLDLLDGIEFVPANYPARRPRHCAMSSTKLAGYSRVRPWRETVTEYVMSRRDAKLLID